jgi:hypothetical protein
MAGEIEAYQDGLAAILKHEAEVDTMLKNIRGFSEVADRGWRSLLVENVGMSAEIVMSRTGKVFYPTHWPSGERISGMLATWHKLNDTYRQLWDRIPQERRIGLQAPGDRST